MSDSIIDIKPPKGMQIVLHNGNPIGYVRDTGDPNDLAEAAIHKERSMGRYAC